MKLLGSRNVKVALVVWTVCACADAEEIGEMSLEDLADVPIVVSGKESSRLFDAPVNSFVFEKEAFTYLPVDSIPEMLRYAPGVHVLRPTNGNWGIAVRGMNSKWFGRTSFTVDDQNVDASIFSGLFGSQHDLIFADIASVEVVYGPGGVLWANNGGNGTVNVVMKTAFETQGNFAEARFGSQNRSVEGRSGWAIDENSAIRVYGKYQNRSESDLDGAGEDDWETMRAGVRYDLRWTGDDLLSFSADVHGSELGYSGDEPLSEEDFYTGTKFSQIKAEQFQAINLQAKWLRQLSDDEGYSLRTWTSFSKLDSTYGNFNQLVYGIEGRGRWQFVDQEIVLSGGVTGNRIDLEDSFTTEFLSDQQNDTTTRLGIQWTKPLADERLDLILSLSAFHETLGNTFELSPTASLVYRLNENERFWLSYVHSARPLNSLSAYGSKVRGRMNRLDATLIPGVDRFHYLGLNNPDLDNEQIQTFEVGYRRQYSGGSELGVTLYCSIYDDVLGYTYGGSALNFDNPFDPYLEVQSGLDNAADAQAYGVNAHFTYVIDTDWRATLTYAYLDESFEDLNHSDPLDPLSSISNDLFYEILSNNSPKHIASLWLVGQLNENWRADIGLRFVDEIGDPEGAGAQDSILQLDAGMTWEPNDQWRASLIGRNLMNSRTDEGLLKDNLGDTSEQRREFYLEVAYIF